MRQAVALLLALTACASARNDEQDVRSAVAAMVSGLEHLDAAAAVAPFSDDATAVFPDTAHAPSDAAIVTFHLRGPILSRRTFVLRRIGGRWMIVHLHASNIRL